ncbi:von Willebrand factor, partial [Ophiophagus hannah]
MSREKMQYVLPSGACCGKCLRTMCEDTTLWSRGDEDEGVTWHNVRHRGTSCTSLSPEQVTKKGWSLCCLTPSVVLHSQVGSEWLSPTDPCIIKKCVRVNEEVFIQTRNVSCQLRDPSSCPFATEMRCDQRSGCCPSCHC